MKGVAASCRIAPSPVRRGRARREDQREFLRAQADGVERAGHVARVGEPEFAGAG